MRAVTVTPMTEPRADRPHMPGYGILGPDEGTGLLPWSWAEERLVRSHDFWLATAWPDGRPHVMPVWAVWTNGALWFSSSPGSRKARNLERDPRCVATTDDALEPVVVEGSATLVRDTTAVRAFTDAVNSKYGTETDVEFFAENALYRLDATRAIGLTESDFAGSPTRWTFAGG